MRERVEGLGGRLHIGPGDAETGLVISAWLPCPAVMEDA
jgi:signal transduction histidine kinase